MKEITFEIDDIFETVDGILWRVSAVVHDDKLVYGYNDNYINEIKFNFTDIINKWTKENLEG